MTRLSAAVMSRPFRSVVYWATVSAGLGALLVPTWADVIAWGLLGAAAAGSAHLWRACTARLGPVTSAALLSVLWALALAGAVSVAPVCPGRDIGMAADACTGYETGTWTFIGLLLPLLAATFWLPARFVYRLACAAALRIRHR